MTLTRSYVCLAFKLNGDIEGLVKEWVENKALEYDLYKKVNSGDKETILSLLVKEPIKKALSVELVGI